MMNSREEKRLVRYLSRVVDAISIVVVFSLGQILART